MKTIKKIIIALIAAIPMAGMAQNQVSVVKDTRGFYSNSWNKSNNGKPIKPFSMTTPDGKKIESKDLKGKVIVLDFWSTWCSPCRDLTRQLSDSLGKYTGNDFIMIGVNYKESIKKGNPLKYWQEHGYKFPMTVNNDAYGDAIGAGNPTVIVIDKEGIIRGQFDGLSTPTAEEIQTLVGALIEKPEISIDEVVLANRNKEYVKAVYIADEVMKIDTVQGKELMGEKMKGLLRVSEWDGYDFIKKVISESKGPEELERNLTNGAVNIAEVTTIQSNKIYLYGAELFEELALRYKLEDDMIVNDMRGRCYFRGGNKEKALANAQKSLSIAESAQMHKETIDYLKGVLDKYKKS